MQIKRSIVVMVTVFSTTLPLASQAQLVVSGAAAFIPASVGAALGIGVVAHAGISSYFIGSCIRLQQFTRDLDNLALIAKENPEKIQSLTEEQKQAVSSFIKFHEQDSNAPAGYADKCFSPGNGRDQEALHISLRAEYRTAIAAAKKALQIQ